MKWSYLIILLLVAGLLVSKAGAKGWRRKGRKTRTTACSWPATKCGRKKRDENPAERKIKLLTEEGTIRHIIR